MNATQFCEKYGNKYARKIPKWYTLGYLGNATKDQKTGRYLIPEDTPLPYSANANVSTVPTLMRDILLAASECRSLYSSMYPKISKDTFDRTVQECVDAKFIEICYTESGAPFLELRMAGTKFLNNTTEEERKAVFENAYKLVVAGSSLLGALATVWPLLQQLL